MALKSCIVKDYMSRSLVTFKPDTNIRDAIHTLVKHRIAGAPVVDDANSVLGVFSVSDIAWAEEAVAELEREVADSSFWKKQENEDTGVRPSMKRQWSTVSNASAPDQNTTE